jgi:hypothetical protein
MKSTALQPAFVSGMKMLNKLGRANTHAAQDKIGPIELQGELIDRECVETAGDTNEVSAVVGAIKIPVRSVGDPVAAVRQ